MIDLLRNRTADKNPYAARNAAALLRYASYPPSPQKDWGDMVRPLLGSASPMVRAAGALLARVSDKFDCYDGEVLQYVAPLVDDGDLQVASAAMIGLAEEAGNLSLEKQKDKIAIFRRVVEKGDPARVKAAAAALEKIKDPLYVPLLYQAARASGETRAWISFPLDRDAAAFLLDRLAEDPADGLATMMLVTSGYVWPPETRPGRLMKLLRDLGAGKMPFVEGAVTRLLTADKNDRQAAEAFAATLKKHLRCGEYWQAAEDCLALAALGVKTDAPIEELLFAPQGYGDMLTAAIVALYATDRESARAPLLALLREGWLGDQDSGLLFAVARHTPWPEAQAIGNKAAKN
jgi:hypothetical protein